MSRRLHRWTTTDLRTVADARRSGMGWRECGALVGVSAQAAQHALRWAGREVPADEVAPRTHPEVDTVRRAFAERNATGDSWSVLSDRVGWPRSASALASAVSKYARRHGLVLKPGRHGTRRPRSTR